MHSFLCLSLLCFLSQAANIVLTNDDGWAELNIRTLYQSLTAAGNSVLISAPADNKSGSTSLEGTPSTVTNGCEFSSCPKGSPAQGSNSSEPRFNYVNSFPVTAMKVGVTDLAPKILGGAPDLVVSGFNVGGNAGLTSLISGTVGAASAAADQLSIPGVAFSGATGQQTAWNVSPVPDYALLYSDLATNLTTTLIASGKPYLPPNTWLNVNFPEVSAQCSKTSDFKFVFSRIHTAILIITPNDTNTCNNERLPNESKVVGTNGCYGSVSVGRGSDKLDASAAEQSVVFNKLQKILSCLP